MVFTKGVKELKKRDMVGPTPSLKMEVATLHQRTKEFLKYFNINIS